MESSFARNRLCPALKKRARSGGTKAGCFPRPHSQSRGVRRGRGEGPPLPSTKREKEAAASLKLAAFPQKGVPPLFEKRSQGAPSSPASAVENHCAPFRWQKAHCPPVAGGRFFKENRTFALREKRL